MYPVSVGTVGAIEIGNLDIGVRHHRITKDRPDVMKDHDLAPTRLVVIKPRRPLRLIEDYVELLLHIIVIKYFMMSLHLLCLVWSLLSFFVSRWM